MKRSFVSLATWLLHPAFVVYSLYFLGDPAAVAPRERDFGGFLSFNCSVLYSNLQLSSVVQSNAGNEPC